MQDQDWTPVILNGKPSVIKEKSSVSKKISNKQSKGNSGRKLQKIEEQAEEGNFKIDTLDMSTKKAIMKARQEKGWSQKEFATKCNLNQNNIRDYESGKVVPPGDHLTRMSKILGIKLKKK